MVGIGAGLQRPSLCQGLSVTWDGRLQALLSLGSSVGPSSESLMVCGISAKLHGIVEADGLGVTNRPLQRGITLWLFLGKHHTATDCLELYPMSPPKKVKSDSF